MPIHSDIWQSFQAVILVYPRVGYLRSKALIDKEPTFFIMLSFSIHISWCPSPNIPDMWSSSPWRIGSRIVAITDLILWSVACVLAVLRVYVNQSAEGGEEAIVSEAFALVGIFVVIWTMFWSAIGLFKATKMGSEPVIAMSKSKFWLTGNLLVFAILCVILVASGQLPELGLTLALRGIPLFIVSKFIGQLEHFQHKITTSSAVM